MILLFTIFTEIHHVYNTTNTAANYMDIVLPHA